MLIFQFAKTRAASRALHALRGASRGGNTSVLRIPGGTQRGRATPGSPCAPPGPHRVPTRAWGLARRPLAGVSGTHPPMNSGSRTPSVGARLHARPSFPAAHPHLSAPCPMMGHRWLMGNATHPRKLNSWCARPGARGRGAERGWGPGASGRFSQTSGDMWHSSPGSQGP